MISAAEAPTEEAGGAMFSNSSCTPGKEMSADHPDSRGSTPDGVLYSRGFDDYLVRTIVLLGVTRSGIVTKRYRIRLALLYPEPSYLTL